MTKHRRDDVPRLAQDLKPHIVKWLRSGVTINTNNSGGGGGPTEPTPPRQYATFVIAASDSTDDDKANANYVCDGTADEVEINAALSATTPSGYRRVLLLEGTFTITDDIVMVDDCVLEGQGPATIVTNASGADPGNMFDITGVNNVTITNLTISTLGGSVTTLVNIENANDITIDNVSFANWSATNCIWVVGPGKRLAIRRCRFTAYTVSSSCISVFADTDDITEQVVIENNIFGGATSNNPDAIDLEAWDDGTGNIPAPEDIYLRNVTVSNNTFIGNSAATGQEGNFLTAAIVDSLTVTGNTINHGYYGVNLADCPNANVSGNTLGNVHTGIAINSDYFSEYNPTSRWFTIHGNTIRNALNGITLVGPVVEASYTAGEERTNEDYRLYATVSSNQIYNVDAEAISLINCACVSIVGNAVSSANPTGIYIQESWLIQVDGNTISDCTGYGIDITHAYDIAVSSNMLCRNTTAGIRLFGATNPSIVGNFFRDNGDSGTDDTADILISEPVNGLNENIYIRSNTFQERTTADYSGGVWLIDPACANLAIEWNWGVSFGIDPATVGDPGAAYTYRYANNQSLNNDGAVALSAALEPGYEAGTSAYAFPEDPPIPDTRLNAGILYLQGFTSRIVIPTIDGSAPWNVTSIQTDAAQDRIFIFRSDSSSVTMVHGNNIHLAGGANFNFNSAYALLTMLYDGTNFLEIARSANT